jgi:predicted transcriptional regulator
MTARLLDLTAEIVISHASVTEMSSDELLKEIKMVYTTLAALEKGDTTTTTTVTAPIQEPKKRGRKPKVLLEPIKEPVAQSQVRIKAPMLVEKEPALQPSVLTLAEAFQPDQVACMICGKKGMKTLKRHLSSEHNIKPGKYRKQFNIPKDQPLVATAYAEKRRQLALDRGMADTLAKAREIRKQKKLEQTTE